MTDRIADRVADLDNAASRHFGSACYTSNRGCPCRCSTAPVQGAAVEHTVDADGCCKVVYGPREVLWCCTPCCRRTKLDAYHRLRWL